MNIFFMSPPDLLMRFTHYFLIIKVIYVIKQDYGLSF